MKNIIIIVLKYVGLLWSFIYPYKLHVCLSKLFVFIRTGWYKNVFKNCDGKILGPIKVSGGDRIVIGKDTRIFQRVELQAIKEVNGQFFDGEIIIGDNSVIQRDSQITASSKVIIGNNVSIAARALIVDTVHGNFNESSFTFNENPEIPDVFLQNAFTRPYVSHGPVIIEDDVHIGMNCTIMPNVRIGHNSVISANTVVIKDVPPYSIVSGNPGRIAISYGKK